jgi:hypothetical protein
VKVAALRSIIENIGPVFDIGYLMPSASKTLNQAIDKQIRKLRP